MILCDRNCSLNFGRRLFSVGKFDNDAVNLRLCLLAGLVAQEALTIVDDESVTNLLS